ncbi:MAG TPA: DUF222 domain-containing protein [Kofleriaceae bacterium]|nr:DUF222 domain-containing protein [Kofleriaceae bacterium]
MAGEMDLLGDRIVEQAAHIDAAMQRLLADIRAFDASGAWAREGMQSCVHWLSWRVGWGLAMARDRVRVARGLGEFPETEACLGRGELSYSRVRAVLRVATPDTESMLLEVARHTTAEQMETVARKYAGVRNHDKQSTESEDRERRYVRRRAMPDGMIKIEAALHPEEAELVWAMLEHAGKQTARVPTVIAVNQPTVTTVSKVPATTVSDPAVTAVTEVLAAAVTGPVVTAVNDPAVTAVTGPAVTAVTGPAITAVTGPAVTAVTEPAVTAGTSPWGGNAVTAVNELVVTAENAPPNRNAVTAVNEPAVTAGTSPWSENAVTAGTRGRFNRADALMTIAQAYVRGDRLNRSPVDIAVTIPRSALRKEDDGVALVGDAVVGAEAARRMSCDAGVVEIIEDDHGKPLSVGRKRRTIPGSIKRALWKRDSACTFPGCTNHVFLEGHHIQHWADGGETSLDNLVLMCSFHHRFVHEYGYAIELRSDGVQVRDPAGRVVAAVPARAQPADLGWAAIRAANAGLHINASTPPCWDGSRISYDRVVSRLAYAGGGR